MSFKLKDMLKRGKRLDKPVKDESEHFMICNICGQAFDMRDFSQVAYHETKPTHSPLQVN